jgi:serine/threonine protein kinase
VNPDDAKRAFRDQQPSQPAGADWIPPAAADFAAELARSRPHWIVRELIGHGGMGAVYSGIAPLGEESVTTNIVTGGPVHVQSEIEVAIKLLRPDMLHAPAYLKRFDREIRALQDLKHPNIVPCLDADITPDGHRFFVMPLLKGRSLASLLHGPERFAQERIVRFMADICAGMAHAHAQGWVHRDLKAANIFITEEDDRAIILDFGVARDTTQAPSTHSNTDGHPGTIGHIAPELLRNPQRSADTRSDVYSLAVVFSMMLMGKVPALGDTPRKFGLGHFEDVWAQGVDENPARRYQSAAELAQAIAAAVGTQRELASGVKPPTLLPTKRALSFPAKVSVQEGPNVTTWSETELKKEWAKIAVQRDHETDFDEEQTTLQKWKWAMRLDGNQLVVEERIPSSRPEDHFSTYKTTSILLGDISSIKVHRLLRYDVGCVLGISAALAVIWYSVFEMSHWARFILLIFAALLGIALIGKLSTGVCRLSVVANGKKISIGKNPHGGEWETNPHELHLLKRAIMRRVINRG